ncbi:MAG: ABC transporter permease [Chloroflexi bacterium OLB15]|nr:MAG: ABC transporter permease [Chloroflexi bacterium OLB15]
MSATTLEQPVQNTSTTGKLIRRILGIAGILFLAIVAAVEIVPFVFTIVNSAKCLPAINAAPWAFVPSSGFIDCRNEEGRPLPASAMTSGVTFQPSLEGYQMVIAEDLPRWFMNSVIFAAAITICRILIDSLAGYSLARLKFPGNRLIFFIILGTLMIPGVVLIVPRFILLKQLGILNTYQGLIIPLAADAFGIFLMKQFFESIPKELEEAAEVDGASRLTTFFRIILPISTPALTALTIFSIQGMWNNFMDALIIVGTSPSLWTLTLGLTSLQGAGGETLIWNLFLAGAVITTVPMAIVFFAFQRYFVEGTSYSGLAGQ